MDGRLELSQKGAIDDETVMKMIEDQQYMDLADYDQLQQQRERNNVFEDFTKDSVCSHRLTDTKWALINTTTIT